MSTIKILGRMLGRPWQIFGPPQVLLDVIVLAIALSAYFIFRSVNPSQYIGNVVEAIHWPSVLFIQFWHAVGGFSPVHWDLQLLTGDPVVWLKATVIGASLGYVIWITWNSALPRTPWLPLFFGLIWAFLNTLPIGLSQKYQEWCLGHGECFYIDTRLAFPGVCLILVAGLYLLERLVALKWVNFSMQNISAIAIGIVAAVTSLWNSHMYASIILLEQPFAVMRNYACVVPIPVDADQLFYQHLKNNIRWHTHIPQTAEMYLARYLEHWRTLRRANRYECLTVTPRSYNRVITTLEAQSAGMELVNWLNQEPWGRWSGGNWSAILVMGQAPGVSPKALRLVIRAYAPPAQPAQRVLVRRNGSALCQFSLTAKPIVLEIPFERLDSQQGGMLIELVTPDAISPAAAGESQDSRILGVALSSMELIDDTDAQRHEAIPDLLACSP